MSSSFGERLYFILNGLIILFYAGAGIFILYSKVFSLPSLSKKILGCTLILYAAYRGYKLMKKINSPFHEE